MFFCAGTVTHSAQSSSQLWPTAQHDVVWASEQSCGLLVARNCAAANTHLYVLSSMSCFVAAVPPELLTEGKLSRAADVFAFGVLLWEMATSSRAWAGMSHTQAGLPKRLKLQHLSLV